MKNGKRVKTLLFFLIIAECECFSVPCLTWFSFTDHLATLCAESAPEEPGDEGADGPDEEPAVGRERHADPQEMTSRGNFLCAF